MISGTSCSRRAAVFAHPPGRARGRHDGRDLDAGHHQDAERDEPGSRRSLKMLTRTLIFFR